MQTDMMTIFSGEFMDNLLSILEQLAKNTDYRINLNELLKNQPTEIKNAFLTSNEAEIKAQFGKTILPDRDKVVQVWS